MRRFAAVLTLALLTSLASAGVVAAPATAQDDGPVVVDEAPVVNDNRVEPGGIIPKPNSGEAPDSATDRGGALQLALLGLLVLFPAVAVLSIRRQIRRTRQPAPS